MRFLLLALSHCGTEDPAALIDYIESHDTGLKP
jgi:hypothetical protein